MIENHFKRRLIQTLMIPIPKLKEMNVESESTLLVAAEMVDCTFEQVETLRAILLTLTLV